MPKNEFGVCKGNNGGSICFKGTFSPQVILCINQSSLKSSISVLKAQIDLSKLAAFHIAMAI